MAGGCLNIYPGKKNLKTKQVAEGERGGNRLEAASLEPERGGGEKVEDPDS